MISSEQVRVEEIDGFPNEKNAHTPLIGYCDSDYYYFTSEMAYHQVCSFYIKQGEIFATNKNALLKQLSEDGYIKTSQNGNTVTKRIGNKVYRFICFPREVIDTEENIDIVG
jgi:hypothetical protein